VVGEHDEAVRARRVRQGGLEPGELVVDAPQRGERVRALDARVVGDLVVGENVV
jgi:hypothetical protein